MNKRTLSKLIAKFFIVMLLACVSASAQFFAQRNYVGYKIPGGILIIQNSFYGYSIMFRVKSSKIEFLESEHIAFKADGRTVYASRHKDFMFLPLSVASKPDHNEKDVLESYKVWESERSNERLKKIWPSFLVKPEIESDYVALNGGRMAMFWEYKVPGLAPRATPQLYVATVLGEDTFVVNAPVVAGDDKRAVKDLIMGILSTLKVSKESFSTKEVDEERSKRF
jgi:hypothetical protein